MRVSSWSLLFTANMARVQAENPLIPTVQISRATSESGGLDYRIWDFGGQDIYHGTHALFLSARAVFVVCWTPESENSRDHSYDGMTFRNYPLAYWLRHVRTAAGPDAPVIVVQTQCDTMKDERQVSETASAEYKQFSGFSRDLKCGARTGYGLDTLRSTLKDAHTAYNPPYIGPGRAWVKSTLEKMLQERDEAGQCRHRTITYDAYLNLCAEARAYGPITDPALLLRFLHNAGTVFHREGLLDGIIILDQDWALNAIYAVFDRGTCYPLILDHRGRFTRPLLGEKLWDKAGFSPNEQHLFISMMQSLGICFAYRNVHSDGLDAAVYIAPELLPEGTPAEVERQWQGAEPVADPQIYAFESLPGYLLRSIMSEIGGQTGPETEYWRDGLSLFDQRSGNLARIDRIAGDVEDGSGQITLRLATRNGRGGDPSFLVEWLDKVIRDQAARFGLTPTVETDVLERLKRRDREVSADREAAPSTDTRPRFFVSYAWNGTSEEEKQLEKHVDDLCDRAEREHGIVVMRDKSDVQFRDSIQKFMELGAKAERVCIFLSRKYLKSTACMFELSEVWKNAGCDPDRFHDRARVVVLDEGGGGAIYREDDLDEISMVWKEKLDQRINAIKVHAGALKPNDERIKSKLMYEQIYEGCYKILKTISERKNYHSGHDFEEFLKSVFERSMR